MEKLKKALDEVDQQVAGMRKRYRLYLTILVTYTLHLKYALMQCKVLYSEVYSVIKICTVKTVTIGCVWCMCAVSIVYSNGCSVVVMLPITIRMYNLYSRFEQRTQEATQLKIELDKAQETITAAETLVGKLEGEFKRWSGQVRTVLFLCFWFSIFRQLGIRYYLESKINNLKG